MLCCFLDTARVRDGEQGVGSRYIQIRIQLHHAAPLGDGLLISFDGAMCCMILIDLDVDLLPTCPSVHPCSTVLLKSSNAKPDKMYMEH